MSAPANLYLWDTNGTNTSAPTSGHQSDGYAVDAVPASSEWNALFANWAAWLQYLQAADFAGNVTVDGDLKVDGTAEIAGKLTADGDASVGGKLAVTDVATFSSAVYELAARTSVLTWEVAGGLSGCSPSGQKLVTTGAWQWVSPYFGDSGDLATVLAVVADPSSAADTLAWELHRVSVNASTGALTDATAASGTKALAGGAQYASIAMPAESASTPFEPLDTLSSYYVKLSGSASGVTLAAGGLRYTRTRPAAV